MGLPGKLTISVWPATPATPRLRMPIGVCCVLTARIASAMPGASRAMTAAAIAALTVYDMVKGLERGVRIETVELLSKSGGRSGDWSR